MSNLQTCWRQTVCQNRLRTASPQGIAALAAQGGVATLTERSDAAYSRSCSILLLTENEAPQDARYSRQESIEVRPLVPKGILSVRQTGIYSCNSSINFCIRSVTNSLFFKETNSLLLTHLYAMVSPSCKVIQSLLQFVTHKNST